MKEQCRELNRVIRDAQDHGLVILAGSAISMAAPSSLPGWTDINTALLDGMGLSITLKTDRAIGPEFVEFIRERRDHHSAVPPDFQAQVAQEECGEDYFRVLQTLDVAAWNSGHGAIAALAASRSVRAMITTNFDRLIERALGRAGVPFDVSAIHRASTSFDAVLDVHPVSRRARCP